ncbi:MAG: hypothetical protein KDA24_16790 [Deltaproteobacteria bacterium]|nr:hypothetical protein [Deltaproteobacteria bacterium]
MTLSWSERHRISALFSAHYPDVRRLQALASSVGVSFTPPMGFDPLFVAASQMVLGAGDKLPDLLAKAAESHDSFAPFAPQPEPEPTEAPTLLVATVTDAEPGAAPRPAGTPAQAPPLDGVETWVARHIEWELPGTLEAGAATTLSLRFRAPSGEAVGGAPAGHTAYVGEPFPVDLELSIEGAGPAQAQQTMRCDPIDAVAQVEFTVTPQAGAAELKVTLRCYSGGYEVGRGRLEASLPSGQRTSGGALAVPDTVLEQINEDAIKTVQTPTTD